MGQVISFSEFGRYYSKVQQKHDYVPGTILDTNVLISLTYEVKSNHEDMLKFFADHIESEQERGFRLFSTVSTRSEFLDFNRRLIMTEALRDLVDDDATMKIPNTARTQIQYQSGQLKRREQQGSDPVFNDTQLKTIKSAFSAGRFSGQAGWLMICDNFLGSCLDDAEKNLSDLGVEYISPNDPVNRDLFSAPIDWVPMKRIAEETCLGMSDAMILNAFQCSRFPFIISLDFDIGYAVMASKSLKDVVMPDEIARKYRNFHFDTTV